MNFRELRKLSGMSVPEFAKYFEITKFRIDTGTVAQPWVNGSGNMFYRDNSLPYMRVVLVQISNYIHKSQPQQPPLLINSKSNWCQKLVSNYIY